MYIKRNLALNDIALRMEHIVEKSFEENKAMTFLKTVENYMTLATVRHR